MNSGVYEIVNVATGASYVGSSCELSKRLKMHRHLLRAGKHSNRHLKASCAKHGFEAFQMRTLLFCAPEHLLFFEQRAIDAVKPVYNCLPVAGSALGFKHSDESKAKISASRIGNKYTLGYRHSPESLARLSACKLGNTYTKGKKRSPEAVAKTSAAHTGMKRSAETRQRISLAQKNSWARKRLEAA